MQAVEQLAVQLKKILTKADVFSVIVDWLIWDRAEVTKSELPPHHRTRTIFY